MKERNQMRRARRWRAVGYGSVLAVTAFLLLFRLNAYALWDDEAAQALFAEQVWQTGDTSAVVGRNIVAYDHGAELENLHDRATPPLTSYLMAPFVGADTISALRPRLLPAFCGVLFYGLFLLWLWRASADATTQLLFSLALIGNVALYLFFRQARYYGVNLVCSQALAYLYFHWTGSRRRLVAISLLMFCLLASHTMTYAAVAIVLAVDYLFWRRHEHRLRAGDWAWLLLPQALLGTVLLSIWNPFATGRGDDLFSNTLAQRAELFWWNLRDLNRAELGVGLLLLIAPFLWRPRHKQSIFLRGPVAIVVYCAVMAMVSPKVIRISPNVADVRYLLPLVPLCLALGALTLRALIGRRTWLALPLGLVAFGTNLFNFGPLLPEGFRSTFLCYLSELKTPVPGPYDATVRWIDAHTVPGNSILVLPGYATYPLMYHAPQEIYAWQLSYPPQPQFAGLGTIQFFGIEPPDYLIAFGPYIGGISEIIRSGRKLGYYYQQVATIDEYWVPEHLPALIDHKFEDYTHFDPRTEAVYVFKRVPTDPRRDRGGLSPSK